MNPMASYNRVQDGVGTMLTSVTEDGWEAPSPCAGWSVRDVAGHVIWGQDQLRCWITGETYSGLPGGPGSSDPAQVAGGEPLATWRRAQTACTEVLSGERLDRVIALGKLGERPISVIVTILLNDTLIHTWDIGYSLGLDVRLPADLVAGSVSWARDNILRVPGFFGPELTPPADADEQTRWLAFLGRDSSRPARSTAYGRIAI
jgi:uncharacterized protein (TIGR03086 family)